MKRTNERGDYPDKDRGFRPIAFCRRGERFKERHLYVRADQIMYDVDAQTALVMRSRRTQNQEDVHTIGTDNADDFRPILHRWLEKYTDIVRAHLLAYIRTEPRIAATDDLKMWTEMDIILLFPEYWNENVFPLLTNAVHDYIVNGILYEYFSLELTPNDPVTMAKAQLMDASFSKIKAYATAALPGQLRKPLQPF